VVKTLLSVMWQWQKMGDTLRSLRLGFGTNYMGLILDTTWTILSVS